MCSNVALYVGDVGVSCRYRGDRLAIRPQQQKSSLQTNNHNHTHNSVWSLVLCFKFFYWRVRSVFVYLHAQHHVSGGKCLTISTSKSGTKQSQGFKLGSRGTRGGEEEGVEEEAGNGEEEEEEDARDDDDDENDETGIKRQG